MTKKFKVELVSWETVYKLSRVLSQQVIESGFKPDFVIGLARGGWVPARNLCDFMGIKDLISFKTEHWGITANPDGKAVLKFPLKVDIKGKNVLVVDDITDTGESMELGVAHIQSKGPAEVRTATLHHIDGSSFRSDYVAEDISWRWVLYPWCFTEDLINLVKNCMEDGEAFHLEAVKKGLEDVYDIEVGLEDLEHILTEMERRDVVERLEEKQTSWRTKPEK
jgi:uncharacterized protein